MLFGLGQLGQDDGAGAESGLPAASDSSNLLLFGLIELGVYILYDEVADLFVARQRRRAYFKKLTKMTPARYRKERRALGLE
jgi:hypothetical protein